MFHSLSGSIRCRRLVPFWERYYSFLAGAERDGVFSFPPTDYRWFYFLVSFLLDSSASSTAVIAAKSVNNAFLAPNICSFFLSSFFPVAHPRAFLSLLNERNSAKRLQTKLARGSGPFFPRLCVPAASIAIIFQIMPHKRHTTLRKYLYLQCYLGSVTLCWEVTGL